MTNFSSFADEIAHYNRLGIDGFFTDDPGIVYSLLQQEARGDVVEANQDVTGRLPNKYNFQAILGALLALSLIACVAAIGFYCYLRVLRAQAPHAFEKA